MEPGEARGPPYTSVWFLRRFVGVSLPWARGRLPQPPPARLCAPTHKMWPLNKAFTKTLDERGFVHKYGRERTTFYGISLKPPEMSDAEAAARWWDR